MAKAGDTNEFHINRIHMKNWVFFPEVQFGITKNPVIAFVGPNNSGKTVVLSSLDIAVSGLKGNASRPNAASATDTDAADAAAAAAAVPAAVSTDSTHSAGDNADTARSSSVPKLLETYTTNSKDVRHTQTWPIINKLEKSMEGFFSVEMTGDVKFGLYSPPEQNNWNWEKNQDPKPCVCFLIVKSVLYLVRHHTDGYRMKAITLEDGTNYLESISTWSTKWDTGDGITDKFCEAVERVLPRCVVHESDIKQIYSGGSVENNMEGIRKRSQEWMVDDNTKQEFRHSDIPSGYKFYGSIIAVLTEMKNYQPSKTCLVLEEPTRCMHPAMIREFMSTLSHTCSQNYIQVIMSTHAPTAIERLPLSQVFLFSRLKRKHGDVQCVEPEKVTVPLPPRFLLPCLFARSCILVEGPTDRRIIENILLMKLNDEYEKDHDNDNDFIRFLRDSVVVETNGKFLFHRFCETLLRLCIPYVIICDGDAIFGGKASGMEETMKLSPRDREDEIFRQMLVAKKCKCRFNSQQDSIAGEDDTRACDGVSNGNAIANEAVWKFAEEHDIFAISHTGRCDLESWLGVTKKQTKKESLLEMSESEITKLVKSPDKTKLYKFLENFAKCH